MRKIFSFVLLLISASAFSQCEYSLPTDSLKNLVFKECIKTNPCSLDFKPLDNVGFAAVVFEDPTTKKLYYQYLDRRGFHLYSIMYNSTCAKVWENKIY